MAREQQTQGRSSQAGQMPMAMLLPIQQFGSVFLENVQQMTDLQWEMARSYTHFAVSQMRDALEVRDPQSLREYFEKQSEATEELTRKVREETEKAMQATEQATRRGLRLVQREGEEMAQAMRQGGEAAQRVAEQGERAAREMAQSARSESGGRQQQEAGGKLPIANYDDLTIDEIEQKLEKLNPDQVRQLSQYEQKNKNRKTLSEAFQRRMQ